MNDKSETGIDTIYQAELLILMSSKWINKVKMLKMQCQQTLTAVNNILKNYSRLFSILSPRKGIHA